MKISGNYTNKFDNDNKFKIAESRYIIYKSIERLIDFITKD